ncbi:hypothetical protein ABZ769_29360 [Streptomyces olivoreticuli]
MSSIDALPQASSSALPIRGAHSGGGQLLRSQPAPVECFDRGQQWVAAEADGLTVGAVNADQAPARVLDEHRGRNTQPAGQFLALSGCDRGPFGFEHDQGWITVGAFGVHKRPNEQAVDHAATILMVAADVSPSQPLGRAP